MYVYVYVYVYMECRLSALVTHGSEPSSVPCRRLLAGRPRREKAWTCINFSEQTEAATLTRARIHARIICDCSLVLTSQPRMCCPHCCTFGSCHILCLSRGWCDQTTRSAATACSQSSIRRARKQHSYACGIACTCCPWVSLV